MTFKVKTILSPTTCYEDEREYESDAKAICVADLRRRSKNILAGLNWLDRPAGGWQAEQLGIKYEVIPCPPQP